MNNSTPPQNSFFTKLFFMLFISNLIVTTFYAIWQTQGKTILSVVLALFIIFFVIFKWHLQVILFFNKLKTVKLFSSENIFYKIIISILIFSICVAINAVTIIDFKNIFSNTLNNNPSNNFPYHIPSQDLVGYTNYVNMLKITKQENYNGFSANYFDNYLDNYFHGISPYHFYEFWLAAFISQILDLQAIIAYWLVVYPLFYFMTWCGLMAITENQLLQKLPKITTEISIKNLFFNAIKYFLLLFVGAIYFPFYKFIPYLESTIYLHNNTILTYGLIEPFLLAAFLLYQRRKILVAWFVILLIPILSITTWVGVLGFLLYLLIATDFFSQKQKYQFIGTFSLTTFLIVLCYAIFGTHNQAAFSWRELLPIFAFQNLDFKIAIQFIVKNILVVFGLYLLKTVVVYLPFFSYLTNFIFSIQVLKKQFKTVIILLLFPFVAMFLLNLHHDATQVFRNFLFPLFNVILIIGVLTKIDIHNNKFIKTILFYCLIIYQISFTSYFKIKQIAERNIYSKEYLTEIAALKPTDLQGKFGGFIYGKDFYQDDLFSKVVRHQLPAGYLAVMPQFYTIVNLEVFDIPKSSKLEHKIFETRFQKNSEFYQFVEKQKYQEQFSTITQSQIDFIRKNQLGFLVISKNVALPIEIQKLIYREIRDEKSGEKFLVLVNSPSGE
jgi:hypothetical protein